MKLSANKVRSLTLSSGKAEEIIFDDDVAGFGVRIREGGSKTYVYQYKLGEKNRRMSLGSVTAIDLGKARDTAKDLYAKVRLGQDPQGEKIKSKIEAAETFKAIAEEYLARRQDELRPGSYVGVQHHLMVHARTLHHLQLGKIDRRDIAQTIGIVTKNAGLVTGNRVRSTLSSLFAWTVAQGRLQHNPVIGTVPNKGERSRDRVLNSQELRAIWSALADDDFGRIMRLLLLTGCRREEIARLRWSEVHGDTIELAGERTKNGNLHSIPLSQAAYAIIEAQPRRTGADGKPRDLIFGESTGPFSGWSGCKKRLDQRIAEAVGKPLAPWRVHDLRRSTVTGMADIGIAPHIIEAAINHISGHKRGVAGIYNRSTYAREVRAALEAWSNHVMAIIEGRDQQSNVTTFRRPA
jgi:integrase